MRMLLLLTFLLQDTVFAFYIAECEDLPKLTYCQDFNNSRWRERAKCKDCSEGTKYHCCKDYDLTKNCNYVTEDCEVFVEDCAVEKFCKAGQEPLLSYIKNQQKLDRPEVYCDFCHNNNRYNSYANKSSATFSECPFVKKNICTPDSHKIECEKSNETSERFCRCDVRNGYHPYSHPDDHPQNGCSFTNYECRNDTSKCGHNQQLLLNYTCAAFCKKGFSRPENSDDCVPNLKIPSTKKASARTDASTTAQEPESTTVPQSDHNDRSNITGWAVPAGCVLILVIIAIVIISICCKRKGICCKRKDQYQEVPKNDSHQTKPNNGRNRNGQHKHTIINKIFNIGGDYIEAKAENLQLSKDGTGNAFKKKNSTASSLSSSSSAERIFQHQHDISNTSSEHITGSRKHSLDRKSSQSCQDIEMEDMSDAKYQQHLTKEEYAELVSKVLLRNQTYMVDRLNLDTLQDIIAERELFLHTELRDIMEQPTTSDINRKFLMRLKGKGADIYILFKEALRDSKQYACLNALAKQELKAYEEIMAERKSKQQNCSNEEINRTDEETNSRDFLASNSASYSSSDGFEPETEQAADKQNIDTNKSKSEIHRSLSDEKIDENLEDKISLLAARDDDLQLENQAKEYLRRLHNVSDDFVAFVKEGNQVEGDIKEKYPNIFEYPHSTVTALERLEKEKNSPVGFEAYKSSGFDNSCLYQSVSILLRGDEQLQNRLRLQTTLHCCKEWMNYKKLYMTHFKDEGLDRVKHIFYDNVSQEAMERISYMTNKEDVIEESLKALIIEIACIGRDSSLLHVCFLGDVIRMPIEQHFQLETNFGESESILPCLPIESGMETLHVYWMDISGRGVRMNHIVPLLKKVARA